MTNTKTLVFGEVLFDEFPCGTKKLGGAPFNAAYNMKGLGLHPIFISRVGDDENGKEIMNMVKDWNMVTFGIQIDDNDHFTGRVTVTYRDGKSDDPRYDIELGSAWDYIDHNKMNIDCMVGDCKKVLLYFGSLCLRNEVSQKSLFELTEKIQNKVGEGNLNCFVDVNLRYPHYTMELLEKMLSLPSVKYTQLNEEELNLLNPYSGGELGKDKIEQYKDQAKELVYRFNLNILVVTVGSKGAILTGSKGAEQIHTKPKTTADFKFIDGVGAGDSFASVVVMGIQKGWSLAEIAERAQEFACKVVGIQGALSKDSEFYQSSVNSWK